MGQGLIIDKKRLEDSSPAISPALLCSMAASRTTSNWFSMATEICTAEMKIVIVLMKHEVNVYVRLVSKGREKANIDS
jgi:hypothetical protein